MNREPKIILPGCVCNPDSELCAHPPTASFWGRSCAKWPAIPRLPQRRRPARVAGSESGVPSGAGLAVRRWLTTWGAISGQQLRGGGSWLSNLLGRVNR